MEEVQPGIPSVLAQRMNSVRGDRIAAPEFLRTARTRLPRGTGRRSELARWLSDPANPLTARVMVNRIWLHHFGRGLVGTPGDFGLKGRSPIPPGTARLAGR
jgi:hypothetical protein